MADQDDTSREHSVERRIAGDTSLAKTAAHDFGGSPQQPMVDAPTEPETFGVFAKITGAKAEARPGPLSGQLVIDNHSRVHFDVISANLTVSPATAASVVSHPFVAGPMSPALKLDAGEVISLPVEWVVQAPGIYRLAAIVRLRERGADSSVPLEHIESAPWLVLVKPVS